MRMEKVMEKEFVWWKGKMITVCYLFLDLLLTDAFCLQRTKKKWHRASCFWFKLEGNVSYYVIYQLLVHWATWYWTNNFIPFVTWCMAWWESKIGFNQRRDYGIKGFLSSMLLWPLARVWFRYFFLRLSKFSLYILEFYVKWGVLLCGPSWTWKRWDLFYRLCVFG